MEAKRRRKQSQDDNETDHAGYQTEMNEARNNLHETYPNVFPIVFHPSLMRTNDLTTPPPWTQSLGAYDPRGRAMVGGGSDPKSRSPQDRSSRQSAFIGL